MAFQNRPTNGAARNEQRTGGNPVQIGGDAVAMLERYSIEDRRGDAPASGEGQPAASFEVDLLSDWAKP